MLSPRAWIIEAICLLLVLALLAYRLRRPRGPLIAARRSKDRRILVRDRGPFRELVFTPPDGAFEMLQASVSREGLVTGIPYTDALHLAALTAIASNPQKPLARALFLGGGPLLVPRQFLELYPDVHVTVVEIDPTVVALARAHFSVIDHPRLSIEIGDGRAALERASPGSLDVIAVDAFGVGTTPRRLASAPFFELCRDRLRPGGCLVVNMAGPVLGPCGALLRRVYAGIVRAFADERVAAFGVPNDDGTEADLTDADNTVAIARRDDPLPPPEALAARAAELPPAMLPYLPAILALRLNVDTKGVTPIEDPQSGEDEALVLW